jgi:plastocyanin
MRRLALAALLTLGSVFVAACGGGSEPGSSPQAGTSAQAGAPAATETDAQVSAANGVDPRKNGFEVALGEWAVTPEGKTVRPGRTVFVISNRGTMPHGFEIEREGDDSSGSGSGRDRGKVETGLIQPGESVRVALDLIEGTYKLECTVEGHDDMGMEALMEVQKRAPLQAAAKPQPHGAASVSIEGFAFAPGAARVKVGQEVTWENHDPAQHTVTQEGRGFDSGALASGETFKTTFDKPGQYRYICALHPGMKGTVLVER